MAEEAVERTNDAPLLPIRVGSSWLALPALQVVEIVDDARPMFLPRAPPHVPGLLNLRGTAVPVLDVALFLGLAEAESGSDHSGFPRVVVVTASEMTVGLRCASVLGVVPAGERAQRPVADHGGRLAQIAVGELDIPGGIATRVDLGALLELARVRG